MYSFKSRIRYSEIGSGGRLRFGSLINYFQDCSTFHSESIGLGYQMMLADHKAWILSYWEVEVERYPSFNEEVEISTWPYGFKGFFGFRNFTMKDAGGKIIARANSLWIYMDTEKMRPVRVPKEQLDGYLVEEKATMTYSDRKVAMPDGGMKEEPVVVQKFQIDTNHHMNNEQYIQIAECCLPEGFVPAAMRAEYKISAMLGDVIIPRCTQAGDLFTVGLEKESGELYAVVEFRRRRP